MTQQTQNSRYVIDLAPFLSDIAGKLLSCDEVDYKDIPLHIINPIIFQAIAESIENFANDPYPYMKAHHHNQIKQDARDYLMSTLFGGNKAIDIETPDPIGETIEPQTNTEQVIDQISDIIEKQVTVYTTDGFGMIQKLQGKIQSAEIAPYAQYDDGIKVTFKRKKRRKSEIIRAYRGWSSEGRDGVIREHGREIVIVPGWGKELRLSDEILDQSSITDMVVTKAVGLDFRTFPTIKEKASAIEGSIVFAITP